MMVIIESFDGLPPGGHAPMTIGLVRQFGSQDGSEYWLGTLHNEITYKKDNRTLTVKNVVVAPGWAGASFNDAFPGGRFNLAYVTDETLLHDSEIDFTKADYVAFGSGTLTAATPPKLGFRDRVGGWFK